MQTYESLKHTTWDCKYHVVFIPKCRRKVLYQGSGIIKVHFVKWLIRPLRELSGTAPRILGLVRED